MGSYCWSDILVLDSGKTIRIKSYSVEGIHIRVRINEKAEMVIPMEWVRQIRVVPEAPSVSLPAPVSEKSRSIPQFAYADVIVSLAEKYAVDWKLVAAVMAVESNFNPRALSPKGALGLMQLMPDTARRYRVRDPYDPQQNIEAGIRHLKMLLDRYQGKLDLALAAYNSGEEAVRKYGGIPPYSETQTYVKKVMQRLQEFSI